MQTKTTQNGYQWAMVQQEWSDSWDRRELNQRAPFGPYPTKKYGKILNRNGHFQQKHIWLLLVVIPHVCFFLSLFKVCPFFSTAFVNSFQRWHRVLLSLSTVALGGYCWNGRRWWEKDS